MHSVSYHYKNSNEIGTYYFFSWDSLTIYDGGSMTSPMIGLYCDSTSSSLISSGHHLFIHFYSNILMAGTGFKLEYNAISKSLGHFVSRAKKKDIEVGIFQSMTCDLF